MRLWWVAPAQDNQSDHETKMNTDLFWLEDQSFDPGPLISMSLISEGLVAPKASSDKSVNL